ncbi:hypothetical protein TGME49_315280 [Toxoplasma gondii ME49]|uniref:Uncharacterized protein n=3 Tax=Toxoplasma gondii TaxID=5811 RepID=A0A125YSD4_TOXGV|nr:hypothetical protein TGME49_315280 [Toxoplasma gondii ME49]EPT25758.1 hypothetical protein TGME49_315280 [Toxoplasma gondii ME49]ESS35367.1 hypothetical protein TGVEG_315280 [Toxoplasma gondii VEG]KFG36866.1 hypothetical protein TGDOM2_315280 [Toxoplasma gondii GAB2-2007-GAL-DOM2]CEL77729.1 TPA: hypothetical protein BN1205_100390 [Toxoplasma gondii VEG]|eukprot:XP_018635340.1 hypothetical protein TGME49_315280 [Toxoplasma gondii ME49]
MMNGFIERRDERRRRAAEVRAAGGLTGAEAGSPSAAASSPRSLLSFGLPSSPRQAPPFSFAEEAAPTYASCRERAARLQAEAAESRDKASCLRMGFQRSRLLSAAAMKEKQAQALWAAADAAEREASLMEQREGGRVQREQSMRVEETEREEEGMREEGRGRLRVDSGLYDKSSSSVSPVAKAQRSSCTWSRDAAERGESVWRRESQQDYDRAEDKSAFSEVRDEGVFGKGRHGRTRLREPCVAGAFADSKSGGSAEERGEAGGLDGDVSADTGGPSRVDPPWVRRAQQLRLEAAEHRDRAQCVRGSKQRGLLIMAEKKDSEADALLAAGGCDPPATSLSRTSPAPDTLCGFHEGWATSEASCQRPWEPPRNEATLSSKRPSRGSPEAPRRFRLGSGREVVERSPPQPGTTGLEPPAPPYRSARDDFPDDHSRETVADQRLARIRQLQEEAACARDKAALVRGGKQRALIMMAEHREQQAELLMREGLEQSGRLEAMEGHFGDRGDGGGRPGSAAGLPPWLRDEESAKGRGRRSQDMSAILEMGGVGGRQDNLDRAVMHGAPTEDGPSDHELSKMTRCLSPRTVASLPPHVVFEVQRLSREVDVLRDKASCCSGAKARQLRSIADIKERQIEDLLHPSPATAPPAGPQLTLPASAPPQDSRGAPGMSPASLWPEHSLLGNQVACAQPQVPSGAHSAGVQLSGRCKLEEPSEQVCHVALGGVDATHLGVGEQTKSGKSELTTAEAAEENHPLAHHPDWQRYNQMLREAREHRGKAACVAGGRQRQLLAIAAAKERQAEELKVKMEESLPAQVRLDCVERGGRDAHRGVSLHRHEEPSLVLPPPRLTRFTTGEEPGSPAEDSSDDAANVECSRFEFKSPRLAQVVNEGRVRRGSQLQCPPYLMAGDPLPRKAPVPFEAETDAETRKPTLEELKRQHELLQEQLHLVEEQLQLHRERQAHEEQRRRLAALEKLEREEREAAKQFREATDQEFLKRQDPPSEFLGTSEKLIALSRVGTQEEGDLAVSEETARSRETGDAQETSTQRSRQASDSCLDQEEGQGRVFDDASSKQSWTLAEDEADEGP